MWARSSHTNGGCNGWCEDTSACNTVALAAAAWRVHRLNSRSMRPSPVTSSSAGSGTSRWAQDGARQICPSEQRSSDERTRALTSGGVHHFFEGGHKNHNNHGSNSNNCHNIHHYIICSNHQSSGHGAYPKRTPRAFDFKTKVNAEADTVKRKSTRHQLPRVWHSCWP